MKMFENRFPICNIQVYIFTFTYMTGDSSEISRASPCVMDQSTDVYRSRAGTVKLINVYRTRSANKVFFIYLFFTFAYGLTNRYLSKLGICSPNVDGFLPISDEINENIEAKCLLLHTK